MGSTAVSLDFPLFSLFITLHPLIMNVFRLDESLDDHSLVDFPSLNGLQGLDASDEEDASASCSEAD